MYSIYLKGQRGATDIRRPHKVAYGQDCDGYYRVVLSNNTKKRYVKIHQLVTEQFIGAVPSGMVINHIDGNKKNNNVDNLEIVTVAENTKHAWDNNLISIRDRMYNRTDVFIKLENKLVHCYSASEVHRQFGLSFYYIKIATNNNVNFRFCYFEKVKTGKGRYDYHLNCYFNGKCIKTFTDNNEAAIYFNKAPNTISTKVSRGNNKEINNYILTFPNVSTIENNKCNLSEDKNKA